ncbi:hypothetical protein QJQ45_019379 [Haematococcus lacustris]|nr:hypothetical protein QJQ45_019379 [Haematococcus lacustris]
MAKKKRKSTGKHKKGPAKKVKGFSDPDVRAHADVVSLHRVAVPRGQRRFASMLVRNDSARGGSANDTLRQAVSKASGGQRAPATLAAYRTQEKKLEALCAIHPEEEWSLKNITCTAAAGMLHRNLRPNTELIYKELLSEYADVFGDMPPGLPPDRPVGHTIRTPPGAEPPYKRMYKLSPREEAEVKKQVAALLAKGIDDLFDKLAGKRVFSSLDLQSGYHQIRITEEDVPKTAFLTPMGQFQFKVLCFGLTNAPATFQRMMNNVFKPLINECVLVYIDDILVMSNTPEEHVQHLRQVLQLMRENRFYAKLAKWEFNKTQLAFLGHIVGSKGIAVDPAKVQVVKEWPTPRNLKDLQAFLGLTNYFRRFIPNFSSLAAPLTNLTSKQVAAAYDWEHFGGSELEAFDGLKEALCSAPVLALPDFSKPFVVCTDASLVRWMEELSRYKYEIKYIPGATNVADPTSRNPALANEVALTSSSTPQNADSEDAMTVIMTLSSRAEGHVYAITTRRTAARLRENAELGQVAAREAAQRANQLVPPDDLAAAHTPGQARMTSAHKKGAQPGGGESLRQQQQTTESQNKLNKQGGDEQSTIESGPLTLMQAIKQAYAADTRFADEAFTSQLYQHEGLWLTEWGRVVVPDDAALRKKVIYTMHDTRSAGHLGMTKTLEQVTRWFTWPGVSENVKSYVRSCHSCQVNKSSAKKPAGLLQPLPIPERPWDSVSMDLIVKLPASGPNKYDSILVFVDRLTKMVHLVKTWESMTATQYAKLFLEHVFRLHGMPRSVVSDRGPQFHNKFWAEVTKLLQVQVNLSSAYHPETDGQTERVNRVIEEMLRHFIRPDQRDWAEYLPLVEFAINNAWQESVRSTPFYLNYGYHPRLAELLDLPQKVPQAHDFVKGMKTAVEQARQCLARAQKRMKSYQDNKRREVLYLPGDMVLLSTQNMRGKANQPGVRKLKPRYVGPFSVQYMVGKAAVKLWLPDEWSRLHNVFHVSLVKPYRTDASEAVPGLAGPPPVQWLDGEPQYTVEKVVGHRLEPSKGKRKGKSKKRRLEFLVKWQGHGDEHNTWELSTQLVGCQELMARYMAEHNLGAEAEEAADGEAEAKDDKKKKKKKKTTPVFTGRCVLSKGICAFVSDDARVGLDFEELDRGGAVDDEGGDVRQDVVVSMIDEGHRVSEGSADLVERAEAVGGDASGPRFEIDDLFDKLAGKRVFSSLDLQSGYHQIRITEQDVPKTAFLTPMGQFQFKVLCFGLTNAPATFQRMMNNVFKPLINECVLVYIDDILVMSNTPEEHVQHLRQVLQLMRENRFYAKLAKWEFNKTQLAFLGHIVGSKGIAVDPAKVQVVKEWPTPRNLKDLQAFLGLTNYFRRFIPNFSSLAAPLTNLTSKQVAAAYDWEHFGGSELEAFDGLKEALCSAPVLALPDFSKPFVVCTDASLVRWMEELSRYKYEIKYIPGATNVADPTSRNPALANEVALTSSSTPQNADSEDAMTVIMTLSSRAERPVYAITTRRTAARLRENAELGQVAAREAAQRANQLVPPDDLAAAHTPGQARMTSAHKKGAQPGGGESLRQQQQTTESQNKLNKQGGDEQSTIESGPLTLMQAIKQAYAADTRFADEAFTSQLYQHEGLWLTEWGRVVVPDDAALRKKVIYTMHDTRSAGHLGMTKTLEQVTRWFTWPGVSENVKSYVRSCHSCQVNKSSAKKPAGLLQPLPIPERPWDSVSMDLIVKLPASGPNKYDSILVFVDRLTKMVHLVKTWESMTATQYAKLFLEHVFRLHGMPRSVVSDRGPQFHNKFWAEVTKLLQVQVNLSSAYHPETDGQTERVNRVIEEMLRHFIRPDQRDWAEYLPLVEFAINNAWQESVRSTPFYLNYGYHPRLAELLDLPQKVPQAHDFVKGMKTAVEQARQCLARAQKRMKSYQDNKRREVLYLPGDMVLLSTQNMRGKANQPGVRKLKPRYVGPFSVQYMVGKAAVKLWLPDEWSRLHNVFHVSLVKPYRTDASEAVPGLAGPPPVQWLDGEPQYTVEKVVGHRLEPSKGKRKGKSKKRRLEFLVKWQGHGDEHNTWELSTQLVGCQELMARYMAEHNLGAEAEEAADGEAEAKDDVEAEAQA